MYEGIVFTFFGISVLVGLAGIGLLIFLFLNSRIRSSVKAQKVIMIVSGTAFGVIAILWIILSGEIRFIQMYDTTRPFTLVLSLVLVLCAGIFAVCLLRRQRLVKYGEPQQQQASYHTSVTEQTVLTVQTETVSEELSTEREIERLKLQAQKKAAEIELKKLESLQKEIQQEEKKDKIIYCEYCDAKNQGNALTCVACGAKLGAKD